MIYFSDSINYLLGIGSVSYIKNTDYINCDSLYYWIDIDSGSAIGNVNMIQDKRHVIADYFHYKETEGIRGMSFNAYKNVTISESDRLINSDTLFYNDNTEQIILQNNGLISEKDKGISGKKIQIQYKNNFINNIQITGKAYAWQDLNIKLNPNSESLYSFRNEMSGKKMFVYA